MALAGHPAYRVTSGQALLGGTDLLTLPAHERARQGLFVRSRRRPMCPA